MDLSPAQLEHPRPTTARWAFGLFDRRWTLAVSLVAHGLLLLGLLLGNAVRPALAPQPNSIDVQLVRTEPAPLRPLPPATERAPAPIAAPAPRVAAPTARPSARPQPAAPDAGMIHPSHLLAGNLLKEAASREVRQTLPKLAPSERATQLCNIEATEQILAADPSTFPDTVRASVFADTMIEGSTVTAPGAAFRSRRKWYGVSFVCTVAPDYQSVTDFRFKLGDPIPPAQWSAHDLNAEDAAE